MLVKFGENLRRHRKLAELTQEELGARSEISAKYLSEVENGIRNPSLDVVHRIALALNIDITELLSFADTVDCKCKTRINQILGKRDDKALQKILHVMEIVFDEI